MACMITPHPGETHVASPTPTMTGMSERYVAVRKLLRNATMLMRMVKSGVVLRTTWCNGTETRLRDRLLIAMLTV